MDTLLATVPALVSVWLLLASVGSVRNTVGAIRSKYIVCGYSAGYSTITGKCVATPRECSQCKEHCMNYHK
jgi:membrane protein required for beta-lactamase induction